MKEVATDAEFGRKDGWAVPCVSFHTATGFDHRYPAHDHASISYVTSGVPMTRIGGRLDGRSGGLGRDRLLMYAGGYERHWKSDGAARSRQFYFNQSLIRECGLDLGGSENTVLREDCVFVEDTRLRSMLDQYFLRASSRTDPPTRFEMDSHAALVALWIVKHYSNLPGKPRPRSQAGLSGNRLRLVLDMIEDGLDGSLRLVELAQSVGLSVRQFSETFRRSVGMTAHQYIMRRQVDRAKVLLARPGNLADIALASGFSSQQHFCAVFRKLEGMTPSQYRN